MNVLYSGSERQFQRSSTALTSGGRGEGDGGGAASGHQPNHYSQAATTRYLIMRKATKKSLKVRQMISTKVVFCSFVQTFCNHHGLLDQK